MKRVLSLFLAILFCTNLLWISVCADNAEYRTISVTVLEPPTSTFTPTTVTTNASLTAQVELMIKDGNVYANAGSIASMFGYRSVESDDGKYISIQSADRRLAAIFPYDSMQMDYYILGQITPYKLPFAAVKNSNGSWVPFQYCLYALDSELNVQNDKFFVPAPKLTLLNIYDTILNNQDLINFDYYSDLGFTEQDINQKTFALNFFNTLDDVCNFRFFGIFRQMAGIVSNQYDYDENAMDLATLFCTNSDKELEALAKHADTLSATLLPLADEICSAVAYKTDVSLEALINMCTDLMAKVATNPSLNQSYNWCYAEMEKMFGKNSIWKPLSNNVDNICAILPFVLFVNGAIADFKDADSYATDALLEYLDRYADDTILNDDQVASMRGVAESLSANEVANVFNYFSDRWSEVLDTGVGALVSSPAAIVSLCWNISKAFFFNDEIEAADCWKLSIQAYSLQYDARLNAFNLADKMRLNAGRLNETNCQTMAQTLYIYLKSSYVMRDALITYLKANNDEAVVAKYKAKWESENTAIAKLLAQIKSLQSNGHTPNQYGFLGFLPDRAGKILRNYDDSAILRALDFEVPEKPAMNDELERDVVLVLDSSGSMYGTPLRETKKAAVEFIETVGNSNSRIGIVTFESDARIISDFSTDREQLISSVENIYDGGGTNTEAGLRLADQMLSESQADKKIIVLMSDGEPNNGLTGEELISYAKGIRDTGTLIYTLGFFGGLSDKLNAQKLMEGIAGEGCHYEVADAESLIFFFGDIADQISGQRYIYIRIACPVDVTVSHMGETLCSTEDEMNTRTDFGTLTFEENENNEEGETESGEDRRIKVLRLKEGVDYNIRIEANGRGKMNYTIGFMDESGEYSDMREFKNIRISRSTVIDTVASNNEYTTLNVDEDGDGVYDLQYRADVNGRGELVEEDGTWIVIVILCSITFVAIAVFLILRFKKRSLSNKFKYCSHCGAQMPIDANVCGQCGTSLENAALPFD